MTPEEIARLRALCNRGASIVKKINECVEKSDMSERECDEIDTMFAASRNIDHDCFKALPAALDEIERLRKALETLKGNIARAVEKMPNHAEFLAQYCSA